MEKTINLALKLMNACGWIAMAGFILFQLLCEIAPETEVESPIVGVLIATTIGSGLVFAAGLAVIAAALVVCSIIAFVYTTYHKE